MTEEHETGANHVIKVIHRFIKDRARSLFLPQTLFIQLDNCTQENKKWYFFAYFQCLIHWNIFQNIEVHFLHIVQPHKDIEQAFSSTSERLKNEDVITLEDFLCTLLKTLRGHSQAVHLSSTVNWSELCNNERALQSVSSFSRFCYFSSSKSSQTGGAE